MSTLPPSSAARPTWLSRPEVFGNIVVGTEQKPYNTLIKDDTRVLWAQAIAIPKDGGTGGQYELTLKNLYGEVTVSLDKAADKTKLSRPLLHR